MARARSAQSFAAEEAFRRRVEELGGVVLEETWKGVKQPHRVRCSQGHETSPRPQSVNIGNGLCEPCGQATKVVFVERPQISRDAEKAFRARLAELGATLLENDWKGRHKPHRILCANGHECSPTPGNVSSGQGICLKCTWSSQDIVYLVRNPGTRWVKFGITSLDPRPRLGAHATDGFTEVLILRERLPQGKAHSVEQALIKALKEQGAKPVRGKEYFGDEYEAFIRLFLSENLR